MGTCTTNYKNTFIQIAEDCPAVKGEIKEAREYFFSKGQACFRTSPLTKSYGASITMKKAKLLCLDVKQISTKNYLMVQT
jgi:hypothetical protein